LSLSEGEVEKLAYFCEEGERRERKGQGERRERGGG
jgi:hypothetical protein